MSVEKLLTHNFRNLINASTDLHSQLNFFIGDNGSGKSSLLESLFYLGHGKSFRTSKLDSLATHEQPQFSVSVKNSKNSQLGLSRNINSALTKIKIDGQFQSRLSVLAQNIAIQIVTPESFKLFFGGPKERRKFVDLGMFHVKHDFSSQWKEFNRVLKQRNACIRLNKNTVKPDDMLSYWTKQFCLLSIDVAKVRGKYVADLITELDEWLSILLPDLKNRVSVQYLQGWSQKKRLEDVLEQNYERENNFGYSLYGAHKFDVRFLLDKQSLETQLSRGQQKLFLLALTFAQSRLIARVNRVKPILLIDDIGAELDVNSRKLLSKAIDMLNCQVLITAIDIDVLQPFFDYNVSLEEPSITAKESFDLNNTKNIEKYKVFHVKHGKISLMYPENSEPSSE